MEMPQRRRRGMEAGEVVLEHLAHKGGWGKELRE